MKADIVTPVPGGYARPPCPGPTLHRARGKPVTGRTYDGHLGFWLQLLHPEVITLTPKIHCDPVALGQGAVSQQSSLQNLPHILAHLLVEVGRPGLQPAILTCQPIYEVVSLVPFLPPTISKM